MGRKKRIILTAGITGCLLFAGCGDNLAAAVPAASSSVNQEQAAEEVWQEAEGETEPSKEPEETIQSDSTGEETARESEQTGRTEPEEITITISAAGDCSLGNYFQQNYTNSFDQTYEQEQDPGYFFENVLPVFQADDMTLVNLEGVLTLSEEPEEGRTFNIKGRPEYTQILTAGSVEAVSMGNNHRLDYGVDGSADTVAALEAADIVYAYDDITGIYEVKGLKIGYVSVNETSWGHGSETLIKNGIADLQEQGADLIIACCHWGVEKDNYTEEYQNELGRICVDAGADLVLGHHPHVLQGIEVYKGAYIVYSLANFSFGANRNPADKDTMIFQQTFRFVEGEKLEGLEAKVIPCSVSSVADRNNYQPTPLTGEEAEKVIGRLNAYSEGFGVVIEEDGRITQNKPED